MPEKKIRYLQNSLLFLKHELVIRSDGCHIYS